MVRHGMRAELKQINALAHLRQARGGDRHPDESGSVARMRNRCATLASVVPKRFAKCKERSFGEALLRTPMELPRCEIRECLKFGRNNKPHNSTPIVAYLLRMPGIRIRTSIMIPSAGHRITHVSCIASNCWYR